VKILEGDLKAMKEKLTLLFNKGNDDDALIDALKRELIAVKQQQQGASARVTSAGREKPSAIAGAGGGAPSAQLTSALKSDLAKVNAACFKLISFVCHACGVSHAALFMHWSAPPKLKLKSIVSTRSLLL
jgi:hypothetical protein